MSRSPKRRYRTPPRLGDRPEGSLTFAEVASLPALRGLSRSTLRNWLADGALGRLPAPEHGRGATVYDAAYVAALVARGRPRARGQAEKPRPRTRASVATVPYGVDEGWATSAELARRHGLPRSSSLVAAVARWNRLATADRSTIIALASTLGPELGPKFPELMATLSIDSRVRIVEGRRCLTHHVAHVALAVALNWKPDQRIPWKEWASACVRVHVTHLPDHVFNDLVETIIEEARAAAERNAGQLNARLDAIVRQWGGDGTATSIEARLDERYVRSIGALHVAELNEWCKTASKRTPPTNREELAMLVLLQAPTGGTFAASGLARPLARRAIADLAHRSPALLRDWRAFLVQLLDTPAPGIARREREPTEDWERALVLLAYAAGAGRRSESIVRELGVAAIVEALRACIRKTTVAQCVALLRALTKTPRLDAVVHHALILVHGHPSRSVAIARALAVLANWALRAGREQLLYAVVASSDGALRSDRWLDRVAGRAWRDPTAPAWLVGAVRDCVVRGRAPAAEKDVLRVLDGPSTTTTSVWSLIARPLARAILADALTPEAREHGRDPTSLEVDWRRDVAVLREASGQRRAGAARRQGEIPRAIALCLELAHESTADRSSPVCHPAVKAAEILLRIADEPTRRNVTTTLARFPALDPHAGKIVATLGRFALPGTPLRSDLFEVGAQALRDGRGDMMNWVTRAFFLLPDGPEIPAAWPESAVRHARQRGDREAYGRLRSGLSDGRLGTEWAVRLLRDDPMLIEDSPPEVRTRLSELTTHIPDFNGLLSAALKSRDRTKRREQRKRRETSGPRGNRQPRDPASV